ncbi:2975_t:CDS:2 [Paraglomus occultum]|uniref:2975_t:CDS:1 n=1 Tax=Paraglomus occultum TaxID=144539 RepID=A0A9N9B3W6_9GLOM|nr:2975_t:CDS:2 [Paraglomus occultum]
MGKKAVAAAQQRLASELANATEDTKLELELQKQALEEAMAATKLKIRKLLRKKKNIPKKLFDCLPWLRGIVPNHNRQLRPPFNYNIHVKKLCVWDIRKLYGIGSCSSNSAAFKMILLAIQRCPKLEKISLKGCEERGSYLRGMLSVPSLRALCLPLPYTDSVFDLLCALSRTAHNLETISIISNDKFILEESLEHDCLQLLIQSQNRLKKIKMTKVEIKLCSLFKLLESQSNSLESIVLKECIILKDDPDFMPGSITFHRLTNLCMSKCELSIGMVIVRAHVPNLKRFDVIRCEADFGWNESWAIL